MERLRKELNPSSGSSGCIPPGQDCEAAVEEVQKHVAALEEQVAAVATVDSAALDREFVESVSAIAPRVGIAGPTPPKSPQSPPWTPLVAIGGPAVQPPVMAASSSSKVDMSHEMHASAQPSAEKEIENAAEQYRLSISEQPEEEQPDPQERAKKRREENESPRQGAPEPVSDTHLRAHETHEHLEYRLLLENKKET